MNDGIYSIPFEQYVAVPAASKHLLDSLARSPLHAWAYFINPERYPQKETPAKLLGSALHTSILEPERFEVEYVQEPNKIEIQKITKEKILDLAEDYKEAAKTLGLKVTGTKPQLKASIKETSVNSYIFWDDLYEAKTFGRHVLSELDWRITKAITYRIQKHPAASQLLQQGKSEQSIFWTDKETGVKCKGRLDWLANGDVSSVILDLKSTQDASPEGFQRSISKYRYHVQAAMYLDGTKELGFDPDAFIFAAWEKHSPYASALYYATPEMLEIGRKEYKRLLKIYAKCLETDKWEGYSGEIQPINLPEYYKTEASPESELEDDWLE